MEGKSKLRFYSIGALICALWFLMTGWLWVYFANLVISMPFGLLGFYFWSKARNLDPANKLVKTSLIILILGILVSIATLIALLIEN